MPYVFVPIGYLKRLVYMPRQRSRSCIYRRENLVFVVQNEFLISFWNTWVKLYNFAQFYKIIRSIMFCNELLEFEVAKYLPLREHCTQCVIRSWEAAGLPAKKGTTFSGRDSTWTVADNANSAGRSKTFCYRLANDILFAARSSSSYPSDYTC
jgi:hypothetical protein